MSVKPPTSATPIKLSLSERLQSRRGWGLLIILSVAFHGGLLRLPMPQGWLQAVEPEPEPEVELEQSGAIALTTLPVITKPDPIPPVAPEPPSESSEPPPTIPEQPPLTQVPDDLPDNLPTDQEPNELDEEPEPVPPPDNDDTEDDTETDQNEPEAGIAVPFNDDFPHMAGARSGCYGLENCRIIEGQSFRDVAKAILQALEAKGYELSPYDNDDSGGGNHRIYEMRLVSNLDAEVEYLNIFGEGLTGAFYMITPDLIQREDLEALALG